MDILGITFYSHPTCEKLTKIPEFKKPGEAVATAKLTTNDSRGRQEHLNQMFAKINKIDKSEPISRTLCEAFKLETQPSIVEEQENHWDKLCEKFKSQAASSGLATGEMASARKMGDVYEIEEVPAEQLYIGVLYNRVDRVFNSCVTVLDKVGVFNKKPLMVLHFIQERYVQTDVIPITIKNFLSFDDLMKKGLLPVNIQTYMLDKLDTNTSWTLKCVSLFHSFVSRVNFVTCHYKSTKGEWRSELTQFDRQKLKGDDFIINVLPTW